MLAAKLLPTYEKYLLKWLPIYKKYLFVDLYVYWLA